MTLPRAALLLLAAALAPRCDAGLAAAAAPARPGLLRPPGDTAPDAAEVASAPADLLQDADAAARKGSPKDPAPVADISNELSAVVHDHAPSTERKLGISEWVGDRCEDVGAAAGAIATCVGEVCDAVESISGDVTDTISTVCGDLADVAGDVADCISGFFCPTPPPTPPPTPRPTPPPTDDDPTDDDPTDDDPTDDDPTDDDLTDDGGTDDGGGGPPPPPPPGGHDDPHLYTWKGVRYDYHGQCDLIYTTCPGFDDGKGLHIHLRTQFVPPLEWSTIANLAVKIGDDTFELRNDGTYYVNREKNPTISGATHLAGHKMTRKHRAKPERNGFTIALGEGLSLEVKSRQVGDRNNLHFEILGVHDHRKDGGTSLSDCVGLTSEWDHPDDDMFLVGRSGTTYSKTNTVDFGPEWQVDLTKGDPMLFAEDTGQQLPDQRCLDSRFDIQDKRHLKALYTAEGGALALRAEDACRHLDGGTKDLFEACVFDVLVTGDVSFAEMPWYDGGDEF